jgi:hypothetical protein
VSTCAYQVVSVLCVPKAYLKYTHFFRSCVRDFELSFVGELRTVPVELQLIERLRR